MYNGIGLQTARGSGTNGYIQRNLSCIYSTKNKTKYRTEEELKKLEADTVRKPNPEILEHIRKRALELKCAEMEDVMKDQGYTDQEIELRVSQYREMLMEREKNSRPADNLYGRTNVRETHSVAEAQQQKNARLKEAFGISEYFVEGSSLDPDRKNKEEAARQAHLKQEQEDRRSRKHGWVATPSPPGSPDRKDRKEKKKKKKRTRDRSSSHESSKRRKSKKSKRSRSLSPKKKKRSRDKKKKSKTKKNSIHSSRSSSSSSFTQIDDQSHSHRKYLRKSKSEQKKENHHHKARKNSKKPSSHNQAKDTPDRKESSDAEKKQKRQRSLTPKTPTAHPNSNENYFDLLERGAKPTTSDSSAAPVAVSTTPVTSEDRASVLSNEKWRDSFKKTNNDPTSNSSGSVLENIAKEETKKMSTFKVDLKSTSVLAPSSAADTLKSKSTNEKITIFSPILSNNKETGQSNNSNGKPATDQENLPSQETTAPRSRRSNSRSAKSSPSRWSDTSSRSSSRSWSSMSISPIRKTSSHSRRSLSSNSRSRSHTPRNSKSRDWSHSRSRSPSNPRRISRSSSKSRSSSRSYSSSSSGRSRRSGKLPSVGKYSGSSRSPSSMSRSPSRSLSGRSSTSKSRSPSIPRRKGSPSFLDKRRITSARKRPVPYHRQTPPPSPSSSSSASSYWWSNSSSRSRSWSRTRSPS